MIAVSDVCLIFKLIGDLLTGLHAVVNNAGVMIMGEYEWLTSSMIAQQVNVNLLGALNVTHAFLSQLRKDQGMYYNAAVLNERQWRI